MSNIRGFNIPRRLSYQVWLLTLPSALISFERRQKVPKLPIGKWRFSGAAVVAAGLGLLVWGVRGNRVIDYNGPGSQLTSHPATAGGIVTLAGIALLLQSTVLTAYSAALLMASSTKAVTLEEPDVENLVPNRSLTP